MTVSVTPTVKWVAQCYDHDEKHEHVSLYLLEEGDDVVLVDSGSFYHRKKIMKEIDDATDGSGPDAIILSHSDYPHAGNVRSFGGDTKEIELVASSGSPEQQGLPDARKCNIGDRLNVKGRTLSFIDPPLADRSHTTWIYDHSDGVLFTADGFGNYHDPSQCNFISSDFVGMIPAEEIYEYHRDNLVWLRYVAPEKIEKALDRIFTEFTINAVAPVHGNPITGKDVDVYRNRLYDTLSRIAAEYDVG